MTKKIAIILASIVILLVIGLGIYLSFGKKTVTQQTYTNPIFGYSLRITDQYKMQSQVIPESIKKQGIDQTCLTLKTDNSCIITLDSLPNSGNVTTESFFQNNSSNPAIFKKTVIGNYSAVTWQNQSIVRYLLINNKIMLHVSFDVKYSQTAKNILETIKM